eukprot:427691-Prorocentrum_minimum.AAC.2
MTRSRFLRVVWVDAPPSAWSPAPLSPFASPPSAGRSALRARLPPPSAVGSPPAPHEGPHSPPLHPPPRPPPP